MPIKATCPCGKTFNAPSKYAGKKVKCPACGQPLTIAAGEQVGKGKIEDSPAASAAKVAVKCKCGKTLQAKAELVGKTVKCPSCSQPLKIRATTGQPLAAANDPSTPMEGLLDDVGLADSGGGGRKCPECKRPMKPEAIICIDCGYNENLGRRMKVQRPVTAEDRSSGAGKRSRK